MLLCTRNKDRDAKPMETSKDGLNVLRRGNVSGSLSENIAHMRKELKSEKDWHKRAIKYGVIKVAVKLKESIAIFSLRTRLQDRTNNDKALLALAPSYRIVQQLLTS